MGKRQTKRRADRQCRWKKRHAIYDLKVKRARNPPFISSRWKTRADLFNQTDVWNNYFLSSTVVSVFHIDSHLSMLKIHSLVKNYYSRIEYSRFMDSVNHFLLPNMTLPLQQVDCAEVQFFKFSLQRLDVLYVLQRVDRMFEIPENEQLSIYMIIIIRMYTALLLTDKARDLLPRHIVFEAWL